MIDVDDYCQETMQNEVYLHTLMIGLACIPTSIWLPMCVHRLGAKFFLGNLPNMNYKWSLLSNNLCFFLVFSLIVASAATILLYFVNNSTQNLILSCIFEALTSLAISAVYSVMVDMFPTNLRVMAAALALTWGRGGALMGNLLFGFLIDLNCVVPIVIFSSMLLGKF